MPTRYDIKLRIYYTYADATGLGRHVVRLEPLDVPGVQRVQVRHVDVSPRPAERVDGTDFFGNRTVEVAFDGRVDRGVEFNLKAKVERRSQRPGLDISTPLTRMAQEVTAVRALDHASPHHFTGASPRVNQSPSIADYARQQVSDRMTAQEAMVAIGQHLHDDMTFVPGATDAQTPPEEAFEQRHGVCQDYAHIMVAALRSLGVPAGYVSGFLRTDPPEGQERLEGADAMHAWVRAWCGREMGWVEYDPTNAMAAGADHIVVGYGRDYGDVAPVKGVARMVGQSGTGHSVDVVPLS
ncbi:MAG: transglutaminase family protein [Pseudomonadota bacterium]